ncbi:MAG: 3-oxoacyl-[acyl-carrier protein] reductase [Verrucomicrobiota bacterium]
MDLELHDQVAFIAGSSRGIGKAIARRFLQEGSRVVISGRDGETLAQGEKELAAQFPAARIMPVQGDLTQTQAIREALAQVRERWGRLDALVANIGSGRGTPGWQIDGSAWTEAFETNLQSAVRMATEALAQMIAAKRGSIVVVSSIAGVESNPAPLPYSCAKTALIAYTKNLARQVAGSGVRVNAVAPGNIFFEGGSWEKRLEANRDTVLKYIADEVPMQRFGTPEEIADLVVFLSSPRASFITGACVIADGGQTRTF